MNRMVLLPVCLAALIAAPAFAAEAPPPGDAEGRPLLIAQRASIEAPWTVDPGQKVGVTVSGGVAGGQLQLWGPVTQRGRGQLLASGAATGGSVPVTAPSRPGSYELRYVNQAGVTLARRSFEVAGVPVRLKVAKEIGAGFPVEIRWHGPARPGDMIQIVDPNRGVVVSEAPAEGQSGAENVTRLRMPQQPGEYLVRYVGGAERAVLRALPVSVGPPRTWMRSPSLATVGESFRVEWNGPVDPDDRFQLVNPANDSVVTAKPGSDSGDRAFATFTAPRKPGRYRVRYVNKSTGQVQSDLPLVVTRQ